MPTDVCECGHSRGEHLNTPRVELRNDLELYQLLVFGAESFPAERQGTVDTSVCLVPREPEPSERDDPWAYTCRCIAFVPDTEAVIA